MARVGNEEVWIVGGSVGVFDVCLLTSVSLSVVRNSNITVLHPCHFFSSKTINKDFGSILSALIYSGVILATLWLKDCIFFYWGC